MTKVTETLRDSLSLFGLGFRVELSSCINKVSLFNMRGSLSNEVRLTKFSFLRIQSLG